MNRAFIILHIDFDIREHYSGKRNLQDAENSIHVQYIPCVRCRRNKKMKYEKEDEEDDDEKKNEKRRKKKKGGGGEGREGEAK